MQLPLKAIAAALAGLLLICVSLYYYDAHSRIQLLPGLGGVVLFGWGLVGVMRSIKDMRGRR